MNCQDSAELLHAYLDNELDVSAARQLDDHLRDCPTCGRALLAAQAVKTAASNAALYHKAPADLRQRIVGLCRQELGDDRASSLSLRRWIGPMALAACLLLAVGIIWNVSFLRQRTLAQNQTREVLDAHLRSLQDPSHLMDVISTDQHTVKPWFDTHVDFSPPVPQLSRFDFPLKGGRLDYLNGHPVAALIYTRGKHVINVFIWPGDSGHGTETLRGDNLVHWTADGMSFWAVSDLNLSQLDEFADLFRTQSHTAPTTSGSL